MRNRKKERKKKRQLVTGYLNKPHAPAGQCQRPHIRLNRPCIRALFNSLHALAAMWDQIVQILGAKLGVSDLDDQVKEKIRAILEKIQARIDEIQKSVEETKDKHLFSLAQKYSLVEDIKVDRYIADFIIYVQCINGKNRAAVMIW